MEQLQDYIAKDNRAAAYRTAQEIWQHVRQLANHPRSGRQGRVEGTYELVVSKTAYIVAYRIADTAIDILAVVHSSQKWPQSFN